MTDPQTPATEAGRRLLGHDIRTDSERAADRGRHSAGYEKLRAAILAIEAEARAADYVTGHRHGVAVGRADALRPIRAAQSEPTVDDAVVAAYNSGRADAIGADHMCTQQYAKGRADALREAAERVRAMTWDNRWTDGPDDYVLERYVLAILDPQP